MKLDYYKELLNYNQIPDFLDKYLEAKSLLRLKKVGYFCGMDYASRSIYDFSTYISRFDHSLTVALLVYKLTHDKLFTLQGLFHDLGTPVFSHVIDYMNEDYEEQESTEKEISDVIKSDEYLLKCFIEDNVDVEDIINFKKCSIVDNKRPKLCADRLDGIILTGIGWTKNINKEDIFEIINNTSVYQNEDNELEIGFINSNAGSKVLKINDSIDMICHSNEDNYMMNLLANIVKLLIKKDYITYKELYYLNEEEIIDILNNVDDLEIKELFNKFKNIKLEDVPKIKMDKIKSRKLFPLVNGKRVI